MTRKVTVAFACLAIAGMIVFTGCGGGNGDKPTFKAYLQHFGGDDWVGGIQIEVLDNDTGDEVGISATSDAEGYVTFTEALPGTLCGFRAVGSEVGGAMYVDTYQFNIDCAALDERLWVVDETTYLGVPLMAGITKNDGTPGLEPGTAVLAGGIYFEEGEEPSIVENHIGCATAATDPEDGQVRYFGDNGLPTTLDARDSTNPLVAYYVVANLAPGSTLVKAFVDGTEIGSTSLHVYADAVSISNIYSQPEAEGGTDPEPAGCE